MSLFKKVGKKGHEDEKLTFLERSLIKASIPLFKIMLWKFKRVRTYGELDLLGKTIESNLDSWGDKYQEIETQEQVEEFNKDLERMVGEIKQEY
jgi:hypothetical protein